MLREDLVPLIPHTVPGVASPIDVTGLQLPKRNVAVSQKLNGPLKIRHRSMKVVGIGQDARDNLNGLLGIGLVPDVPAFVDVRQIHANIHTAAEPQRPSNYPKASYAVSTSVIPILIAYSRV